MPRLSRALAGLFALALALGAAAAPSCRWTGRAEGGGRYELVVEGDGIDAAVAFEYEIAAHAYGANGPRGASYAGATESVPNPPRNARLVPVNATRILVFWDALPYISYDVLGYVVRRNGSPLHPSRLGASARSFADASAPPPGDPSVYAVAAVNAFGEGTPAVVATRELPAAPSGVRAEAINATALRVDWTPPVATPDPIVRYEVALDDGDAAVAAAAAPPIDVGGLVPGQLYAVRVRAIGSRGSASMQVYPAALARLVVPPAPASISVAPLNGTAMVSWSPPASTPGAPVLGYRVYRDGAPIATVGALSLGHLDGATLSLGRLYAYGVSALNALGEGARTANASYVHVTVPGAPTAARATSYFNVRSATVTWSPPAAGAGGAPDGFEILRFSGGVPSTRVVIATVGAAATSYVDATAYGLVTYAVRGINRVGAGPLSNDASVDTTNISQLRITDAVIMGWGLYDQTIVLNYEADSYGDYNYVWMYNLKCRFSDGRLEELISLMSVGPLTPNRPLTQATFSTVTAGIGRVESFRLCAGSGTQVRCSLVNQDFRFRFVFG